MKKIVGTLIVSMSLCQSVGGFEGDLSLDDFPVEKDELKPLIEEFEGLQVIAYKCPSGVTTIGYGSTRYESGGRVRMGDVISVVRAEQLLERDIDKIRDQISDLITADLTKNQYDALVSFVYNVGITNFKDSKLLEMVNENPNNRSIKREFMKWVHSNGKRLNGLVRRRKAEIDLYYK
jgi:lysozyme